MARHAQVRRLGAGSVIGRVGGRPKQPAAAFEQVQAGQSGIGSQIGEDDVGVVARAQQQAVLRLGAGARVQATEHAQFGGEGIAHHGGAVL